MTVAARTGPQFRLDGIALVGRPVGEVEADLIRHAGRLDQDLVFDSEHEFGPQDAHLYVRADRAGDRVISGLRLFAPDRDHRRRLWLPRRGTAANGGKTC
ncbi:hypothetical protein [Kitasatospora cheerisanensis]|uniref:Uncharacterized protein n=1 Tax=Kitasatospora cheerisanensis KCTC 2395 TaxID=1348663 RepID=A0A066ZB41_9ACTN|nr:hypothetical protein [Kitasatospora cheerisanensis]KDN87536.1 hypothetical protein KCH_07080 [Kitasatospora cheerisanensis KCTC 2395]